MPLRIGRRCPASSGGGPCSPGQGEGSSRSSRVLREGSSEGSLGFPALPYLWRSFANPRVGEPVSSSDEPLKERRRHLIRLPFPMQERADILIEIGNLLGGNLGGNYTLPMKPPITLVALDH